MKRPPFIGVMGPPKEGKTALAVTMAEYLGVENVIHFDNHGSTDAFDLHQYTKAEPWGVRHIPADKPNLLLKYLKEIRTRARIRPPYAGIIIDDWSEYAQTNIEAEMEDKGEGKKPAAWGIHGDIMREAAHAAHPAVSGATVLCLFQAAQMADPLVERPKKVVDGELKYSADTRKTMLRPFLQGAFAAWLPYKLDALFYQHMREKGDKFEFLLQLAPDKKTAVLTRWLQPWVENPRLDKNMLDPTWKKLMTFIQAQTKSEET